MRNESPPSSSIRSASRSNCSASSSFLRKSAATSAIIGRRCARPSACPTYNELENLEPMLRALAGVLRDGDRVLVIDDNSPDGTGELGRPPRRRARLRRRAAPPGARRGSGRRTSPASAARSPTAPSSCSRWTATSPTTRRRPAADRRGRGRRRPRARLALRPRRVGGRTGGSSAGRSRAARGVYTALFLQMGVRDPTGGFKCFRRRVLETIDLDAVGSHGLRLPDRDDVSRASAPASASSRCRSRSPTASAASRR